MAGNKKQTPPAFNGNAEEFLSTLQSFLDAVGSIDLPKLNTDVQSLTFDNERIVKPALKDIREILGRDVYASKSQVADLKKEIEDLKTDLEAEKKRTKNYELVEKVVFGLVGLVLLSVGTAIVALVVISRGGQ